MRKICDSSKTSSSWAFSFRAEARSEPNGFSITIRTSACSALGQAGLSDLAGDHGEEIRRGGEVEDPVHRVPGALVELLERPVELRVDVVVVERPRDVPDVLEQAVQHVGVGLLPGEALDRLLDGLWRSPRRPARAGPLRPARSARAARPHGPGCRARAGACGGPGRRWRQR